MMSIRSLAILFFVFVAFVAVSSVPIDEDNSVGALSVDEGTSVDLSKRNPEPAKPKAPPPKPKAKGKPKKGGKAKAKDHEELTDGDGYDNDHEHGVPGPIRHWECGQEPKDWVPTVACTPAKPKAKGKPKKGGKAKAKDHEELTDGDGYDNDHEHGVPGPIRHWKCGHEPKDWVPTVACTP